MKLFSILQQAVSISYPGDEGDKEHVLLFSQDPNDSSLVRMRIEPSDSDEAVEITFTRNGGELSRRLWSKKYPAWDQRSPAEIDEAEAKAAKARDAKAEQDTIDMADREKATEVAPSAKRGKVSRG